MATEFPGPIGAPATRALTRAGIISWADLAEWAESDVAELHGVGPKAIGLLSDALAERNKSFSAESSATGRAQVYDIPVAGYDAFKNHNGSAATAR